MRQGLYAFALLAGCSFPNGQGSGVQDAPRIDAPAIDTPMIDVPMMLIDGPIDTPTLPTDTDGDGVPDASDNCPAVANANQRNHDGDAKGDACDGCPHLASAIDPDGDLDGVGDACDPRPTTAGDSIALFEGFYDANSINAWTINGGTHVPQLGPAFANPVADQHGHGRAHPQQRNKHAAVEVEY